MTYEFLLGSPKTVLAEPYELVLYDNEWRLLGWSYDVADFYYWKLSRILDLKITDSPFRIPSSYKREKMIRNGLFVREGEMIEVTAIAKGVRAKLFKEKQFGPNQRCKDLPDGTTEVTLEMQKNPSTYNFLLGCGELLTVVKPLWLAEKIYELSKDIYERYDSLLHTQK